MTRPTEAPEAQESAPLLKNLLDAQVLAQFADAALQVYPAFDRKAFLTRTRRGLEDLSIMARIAHAADGLRAHLPEDYPRALTLLRRMAPHAPRGLPGLVLPEFVGRHGLEHFDLSLDALRELTPYSSSEFAVRPFLAQDPTTALAHALRWAEDDNDHVRRLASEGTRPRLPWARRLPLFIAEPRHALPILERLRADPSDYVRRSVANHLNDITKDHPEWMLDLLESWPTDQAETGWIAKHALRNLIKAGLPRALGLIGASADARVVVDDFSVRPATLRLGERLRLSLALRSTAHETQHLVVDYAIHYVKKNGETSRKVFKWRTAALEAGATLALDKQQTVQDYTTRKHYPGVHAVELLVNGMNVGAGRFRLLAE